MPVPETELSAIKEKYAKLRTFLVTGNGAGLIASLTFLGTVLSNETTQDLARPFWWVVLCFVIGLFGSWAGLVSETMKTLGSANAKYLYDCEQEGKDLNEVIGDSKWDKDYSVMKYDTFSKIEQFYLSLSSLSLVAGAIAGMVLLYQVTDF